MKTNRNCFEAALIIMILYKVYNFYYFLALAFFF